MNENDIGTIIVKTAINLHKNIGTGLFESVYEKALEYNLRELGLDVKSQLEVPFVYKEIKQDVGFRLDLLIENKVIIEIKAIERLALIHFAQTLTYLKLSDKKLGYLINFHTKILKEGIHSVVNNL